MLKRLLLFCTAIISGSVTAQSMQEITSENQTLISKISMEQRVARYKARHGSQPKVTFRMENEPNGKDGLDIFPDTLYAGEPFDVQYGTMEGHEATFELYDLRGKRPKRMAWKRASKNINGRTFVRITIDEPGTYEVVAYDEEMMARSRYPELRKSRWTISVREPRKERP